MKTRLYSVYDLKAKAFLQPFFSVLDGTAIRAFSTAVNDPSTMLNKHPEDYILFYVGEFDDESGALSAAAQPVQLVMAAAVYSERVPDAWKEFLPLTWEEAVGVVGLYYNSVEPTKFNQYQALQMTKAGGGYVLNSLINQIETHHQSIGYNQFVSKVEEEKKDLSPMTSEDGNSELPPESTESIVTN